MVILAIFWTVLLIVPALAIDRNICFPVWVFLGSWLSLLIGIEISGDLFYGPIGRGYLIYMIGATAFATGAYFARLVPIRPQKWMLAIDQRKASSARGMVIKFVIIGLAFCLPFYLKSVFENVKGGASLFQSLTEIRQRNVEMIYLGEKHGPIDNLVVIAEFMALVAIAEIKSNHFGRLWAGFAVIIAFIYGITNGSKGILVILPLEIMFLTAIKRGGTLPLRKLSIYILSVFVLFCAGLIAVNLTPTERERSSAAEDTGRIFLSYWLGGMVAYDRIASGIAEIENVQKLNRPILEAGRKLGADVDVPPIHAEYVDIGPKMDTNVYTIFLTYNYSYGLMVMTLLLSGLGIFTTLIYRLAISGSALAILYYPVIAVKLILSFVSDHFILGYNPLVKLLFLGVLIYWIVPSTYTSLTTRKGMSHA